MMNRLTLWLHLGLTLTLLAAISLMSYFGYPNPVIVGLQSSIAIGLLFTVIVIGLYFLPHKLALAAFLLLLLLYLLLTVGNWWHFQYFQVYFNFEFLRFARDSGEAFRSLNAFTHLNEALVLLLLLLFTALLFWFWKRSKINHRLLKIQAAVSLLLGLSFLYLANSNIELLRSVNALTLSPYYFHPVHAFFYSDEASPEGSDKKWLAFKQRNTVTHRQQFLPQGIQQKHYNIIVLTMESFSR